MKCWVKVHNAVQNSSEEIVIAACDEELLGKEFGNFKISESFFKGNLVEADNLDKYLKEATIVNLVGENVVNWAIKKGAIKLSDVKKNNGISNAQIFLIH